MLGMAMTGDELAKALDPLDCCGRNELIMEKLEKLLTILDSRVSIEGGSSKEGWDSSWPALIELLGSQDGGDYWMWLHVLSHLELTEHGGGIAGSWLTHHGEEVLRALDEHGTDPDKWKSNAARPITPATMKVVAAAVAKDVAEIVAGAPAAAAATDPPAQAPLFMLEKGGGLTAINSAAEFIAAVRRCDDCDPSFGCWDGKSEPCSKVPLIRRNFRAFCGDDTEDVVLTNVTDEEAATHMAEVVDTMIANNVDAGWNELAADGDDAEG